VRTLLLGSLLVFGALAVTVVRAQDVDQAFTISIGSSTTDVGSQSSVELLIDDIDAGPVGAWTIDVAYVDDIISPVECEPFGNSVCDLEHGPNTLRVSGASVIGLTEETVLAVITFRCSQEGSSQLSVTVNLFGVPETVYDVQAEDGMLGCEAPEPTEIPDISLPPTGTGSGAAASNWPTVLLLGAGGGLLLIASAAALRRHRVEARTD